MSVVLPVDRAVVGGVFERAGIGAVAEQLSVGEAYQLRHLHELCFGVGQVALECLFMCFEFPQCVHYLGSLAVSQWLVILDLEDLVLQLEAGERNMICVLQ